ncbi:MAG: cytochrome c [Bacteroidota bacterium]
MLKKNILSKYQFSDTLLKMKYCFFVLLLFSTQPQSLFSQEASDFFRQNCMSCHTIGGGRLTGPDLKNVNERKERAWLIQFLIDPKSKIDAGDPYALQLQSESRGAIMPAVVGMNKARAESLLDMIITESKMEKSNFAGLQVSDRPFTARDVEIGREIFMGTYSQKNGGPSCISCHSVHGLSGFGGGALAPDLTTVFERYQGRKTLATWLSAPATPTMQSVFKKQSLDPEEILALTAFFQSTLQRNPEDASTARLNFILFGLGGTLLVLGIFDVVWNKRFRAVRRPLIEQRKSEIINE